MRKILKIITVFPFIVTLAFNSFGQLRPKQETIARVNPKDMFSVWISKIDGTDRKLIITDPKRQMSHTRVSPDGQWITFTRYNNYNHDGLAMEQGANYPKTEICLMKIDGTGLKTIVGPEQGKLNANSSWSSDGKRIIFMSGSPKSGIYLYWYHVETGEITKVPNLTYPNGMLDPHEAKDNIIFISKPLKGDLQCVWMMKYDGSDCRQISFPKLVDNPISMRLKPGDYDPRFSPDGAQVAVFRQVGGAFHIIVIDVATGEEKNLTINYFPEMPKTAEGVADWSSDGKLLIFRHIAMKHDGPKGIGIYVMKPDGTQRRRIPIAKGEYPYVQPGFLPGGSGDDIRVIYQTIKNPDFNF